MSTELPGKQVTTNLPPLPNVTKDTVRPTAPASWDDFGRISATVFQYVSEGGRAAADKLVAWINAERNK